jgi:hypothetical protein
MDVRDQKSHRILDKVRQNSLQYMVQLSMGAE